MIESYGEVDDFIYRKFSSNDIAMALSFGQDEKNMIDNNTLWASFANENLLSLIKADCGALQDIHNHLKAQDFNNLDDEESGIPTLRRINYLLQLRKV